MSVVWGNDTVLLLIELYESRDLLWDTSHRDYRNKIKKNDAWEDIAKALKLPRKEIEAKVHTLRSQFVRERKKVKSSKTTGSGREDVKSSAWFAYDAMKFLLKGATTSGSLDTLDTNMCLDMSCVSPSIPSPIPPRSPSALPLWSPLLALQACRIRRYLSDDCMAYQNRHLLHSERRRCGVCLASFPSTWLLERHAALQHASQTTCDDKPFVCEQCGQSYRYRSAYVKHKEQNHRARLPADKLFTCDVCGMQFRYLKSFKKHRLNHTLERLHTKTTDTPEGMDQVSSTNEALIGQCGEMDLSMKKKNKTEGNKSPPIDVIRDAEQDSTVDSNGASDSIVTVDDSIECRTSETDSKRDDDTGSEERRRVPVSFASVSSMADSSESESRGDISKHETSSSHSGILGFMQNDDRQRDRERRFACPFCGKCVRSKENLKLHVRKHTGERPFVCLFCGRAFGGKSDLTRHLRIHTGERPYHCEACGKCFARADYLSKHLTTHVHNTR